MKYKISAMTIELIMDIILEQNRQLLKIIADDYDLYYPDLLVHIPDRFELVKSLTNDFGINHLTRLADNTTSSSLSSSSSSSLSLEE